MQQEDYLQVNSHILSDDSVVKFSYRSYISHNILTINNSYEIRISIYNQDIFKLTFRTYIYIKGEIVNYDKNHFVNNGLTFLFDEI